MKKKFNLTIKFYMCLKGYKMIKEESKKKTAKKICDGDN